MRFKDHAYPEDHELPDFLQKPRPGLIVDRTCEDLGPGTHLFNGLRYAKQRDAFVMIAADDMRLSKNHIALLLATAKRSESQGSAVATLGVHSLPDFRPCLDTHTWTSGCLGYVDLGFSMGPMTLGWLGCIVRPWFFYPQDWEPPDDSWPTECFMHDDLWLSATLAQRGIRRASYNLGLPGRAEDLETSKDPGQALFHQNRWNLHVCNEALLARFPGLWEPRPRVVALAPGVSSTSCLGHVDQWHRIPSQDRGLSIQQLSSLVQAAGTSQEHWDTVVVIIPAFFREGFCRKLSAVLQCALQ
ncbi:unnamed protein product, partial [Symbiodinium pilosum]